MRKGQRLLSVGETRELIGLLQASAAFGPPRDGLRLPDNDFWWLLPHAATAFGAFKRTITRPMVSPT